MSHVRPDRLADFARGRLGDGRMEKVSRHVDGCAHCKTALERVRVAQDTLKAAASEPVSDVYTPRAEATFRWMRVPARPTVRPLWWLGLAGSMALAGFALMLSRRPLPEPAPIARHVPKPQPTIVDPQAEALVLLLAGRVEQRRDGMLNHMTAVATVREADHLSTAAQARLVAQWADGAGFLVGGATELGFERLHQNTQRFVLEGGQFDLRVPASPVETAVVRTPNHLITTHGSWFVVAADVHSTTVEVLEGSVEITDLDGSSSTVLRAPAKTAFRRGRIEALDPHREAGLRKEAELHLQPFDKLRDTGFVSIGASGSLDLDGLQYGSSPATVRLPLGRHMIEVSRRDLPAISRTITVEREADLKVALLAPSLPEPDAGTVEEMVAKKQRQIRACYERSLKRDPSLTGALWLQMKVDASGRIVDTSIEEGATLVDEQVASCLQHEARTWRLSQSKNATFAYQFVFRPR
jgi:hypothetical protein